ncbi:conserved hypothetical protein [Culex quinquefasciatus]|uniref:Uncharacterized protein n=1 Tax=Culex quinquefasciatus TaxID=7176 RepID=B0WVK7_CULQU|nr:conserved hypothetical protein [Culex quinquefasciatus]|eukprot:XP_001861429.1 conserved hypothetical protein [Culex quinquefasciatus]
MLSLRLIAVVATLLAPAGANSLEEQKQKYRQSKGICAKLLRVPADIFERYDRSEYAENHDTYCFIRCVAMLHGHYDDEQGLLVDSLYEAASLGKSREEFTELMNGCQAENGEEDTKCYCRKAFKPMLCFGRYFNEWRKKVASD